MDYKESIQKIQSIDWSKVPPSRIISQALFFAEEFSKTARWCIEMYHDVPEFEAFIAGELDTDNLQYADYNKKADHYLFLDHFYYGRHDRKKAKGITIACIEREGIRDTNRISFVKEEIARSHYTDYTKYVLNPDVMMATLVSREVELKGIFQKILKAHPWVKLGYGYYRYFLQRHIELDSADGGHEEMTSRLVDLEDYEGFLHRFWQMRWLVYKTLL